ncbi:hypothetical protein GR160_08415 [Flavobacterium sp. Sd200]|uniref:ankyrin repeat domain-containing protein n=1 Tax=Flavobacterium sp. Sd200 TaxID=2692211 RepID=UPI001372161D|nr:ankyrin repeat domain-containing protein [Flavobacterium sp. Sd200]MXN91251.1 hypothetical protein [Flavobacterium sp. Sd200]
MSNQAELIEALQRQKIDDARQLLKSEENIPDNLDSFKNVALFDILLRTKAFDIIDLFIDKGLIETDIYEYDTLERTFFDAAFRILEEDEESVAFINNLMPRLSSINDAVSNKTLLGLAIDQKAKPLILKAVIDGGADINTVNNAENTYLHQVANNYNPDAALVSQYAQILIDNGVDVNARNIVGETPLMAAISRNQIKLAEVLLQNGASTNEQNKQGETPYYLAVVNLLSLPFYELLKGYEAPDFDKKTKDGVAFFFEFLKRTNSPSTTANDLLKAMIADGADLFQTSTHYSVEKTAFDILAEKPFEVFETVFKSTDLDVAHTDDQGNTLLHKVCAYNVNYDQNAARDTYKKTKLLIEAGADANAVNAQEQTPMMLASADNLKSKTVELLLQHSR